MRNLTAWMLIGWIVLMPVIGHAQSEWGNVQKLAQNTAVRVRASRPDEIFGVVKFVDDVQISLLDREGRAVIVPSNEVRAIEQLVRPGGRARGARKGLIWGAILSAIATYTVSLGGKRKDLPIVYAGLLGGSAAIGALTANKAEYRVVYQTP